MTRAAADPIAIAGATRVLGDRYGLEVVALGERAVVRAVAELVDASGADAATWVARLDTDDAEQRRLAEAVLVPETMLFRDGSPFGALAALAEIGRAHV